MMIATQLQRASAARPQQRQRGGKPAVAQRPRVVRVQAVASTEQKPALAKFADSIGLPTDEGLFGFRPFAEQWCGRLAMAGLIVSIVEEAMTGRGTLAQLGIETPSGAVLGALCAVFGGATLVGAADTVRRLVTRQMSPQDVARYKSFLGLNNANDFMAAAAEMKRRGDFTSLSPDAAAIAAARASGMPADRVLGLGGGEQADDAAREMKAADASVLTLTKAEEGQQVSSAEREMKARAAAPPAGPSVSLAARADILEQGMLTESAELAYAKSVELSNGRSAMVGFLAAVLVEAATGKGIILQIIMWLKLVGLLGAESGF